MPRRASSSAHPVWILIGIALLLFAGAGGYTVYQRVSDPYRTMTAFPVSAYLENSNSLRGNSYKLDGTIGASIDRSPSGGRLFSVEVGNGDVVAILVPPELNRINIERGQRYRFKVTVGEKGIVRAVEATKS